MSTLSENLLKVRDFYKTNGWCQGALATDIDGRSVDVDSRDACRFSLSGAAYIVLGSDDGAYSAVRTRLRQMNLWVFWNDASGRTKEDVIRMLERLAASCK